MATVFTIGSNYIAKSNDTISFNFDNKTFITNKLLLVMRKKGQYYQTSCYAQNTHTIPINKIIYSPINVGIIFRK